MKIVRTKRYLRDLRRMRVSASDITRLESEVATAPLSGDVIPGLEGMRKLRFGLGNKGKRGGGRAIYFLVLADETVVMVFAYAKSAQEDLTEDQRRAALAILQEWNNDETG